MRGINSLGFALAVSVVVTAGCGGSDTVPVVDVGVDAAACGFVAVDGCPGACLATSGVVLTDAAGACVPYDERRPTWCGDPNQPSLGAMICAQLPSGERVLLVETPGDLPASQPCDVTFCLEAR